MRVLGLSIILVLAISACGGKEKPGSDSGGITGADADGDGFADDDCDDGDPDVNPDATEVCDGVDNDCDGLVDEGTPDGDGDGLCDQQDSEECDGLDNDGDGEIDEGFGDADGDGLADCLDPEVCDGRDNDGDGNVDEDQADADGDGLCDALDTEDCDGLDNDGDGVVDEGFVDGDGDGVADCVGSEDCDGLDNDGDGVVDEGYPDSDGDGTADCLDTEECDGLDNDGDGDTDEDYPDTDGDGWADCVDTETCDGLDNDGDGEVDEGMADTDGDGTADCVDSEECDGLDNDGDGSVDEGMIDTDGDGTCDGVDVESCDGLDNDGDGSVDEGMDDTDGDGLCDDLDTEECDGLDNDGDGTADDGFDDTDGDGIADCVDDEECDGLDNDGDGEVDEGVGDDDDGDGYSECDGDCDDDEADAFPGNTEAQDGLDNDCDDYVDEDFVAYGDIVITEVMVDPDAAWDSNGEYFELYNASSSTIYLANWLVHDGGSQDFTVDEPLIVTAGSYAVLARSDRTGRNGGVDVDYAYGSEMSFANGSSDALFLEVDGVVIDELEWDGGSSWPSATTGYSMELDDDLLDAASNDEADAWCLADSEIVSGGDMGSPGADNGYCGNIDHDGDGYTIDDGDCDDFDPATYPGAPETEPGVDNDCDGVVGNTVPMAVADYLNGGDVYNCEEIELDGTGSYDPDGDPILGYSWTLESAPAGSGRDSADIFDTSDASPVFSPDLAGTYTFGLVVNDGSDDSLMDTVDVEVDDRGYNDPPVADAGRNGTYSDAVTCTVTGYGYVCPDCATVVFVIDGTGSSDPDGDSLEYSWSTTSSYASIADDEAASTSVTVSGIEATYGSTVTETITMTLEVTDCAGESSTDTMEITYSCTGS